MLLRHRGHEALEASDGLEALVLIRSEQPDLVVCDILMPTMDGYELVRQLRAEPAIAATRSCSTPRPSWPAKPRSVARASGVSHVLFKPCDPEDMLAPSTCAPRCRQGDDPLPIPWPSDRDHSRVLADTLVQRSHELQRANHRLSALTELSLHLASERDPEPSSTRSAAERARSSAQVRGAGREGSGCGRHDRRGHCRIERRRGGPVGHAPRGRNGRAGPAMRNRLPQPLLQPRRRCGVDRPVRRAIRSCIRASSFPSYR